MSQISGTGKRSNAGTAEDVPAAVMPNARARTPSLRPTQSRSQASLERMLQAASGFMMERESEEFTLLEVSQSGRVSIGSIYHRFRSKDDLVRAVIARGLAHIGNIEQARLDAVLRESTTLGQFVPKSIANFSRTLQEHAIMLRLAMQRAASDAEVSISGDNREQESTEVFAQALCTFQDEIAGDALTKGRMAHQVIFATLARHIRLTSARQTAVHPDWDALTGELAVMMLAYLKQGAEHELVPPSRTVRRLT